MGTNCVVLDKFVDLIREKSYGFIETIVFNPGKKFRNRFEICNHALIGWNVGEDEIFLFQHFYPKTIDLNFIVRVTCLAFEEAD